MGLIDLAFDGSGSKAARINMGALLRQDLDPQPPSRASKTQQMVKNKGKNRETVRSRQSRVQVPKPTRKTPLLKKNEELFATSSTKPPPRGPPVVPPTKRAAKYQPPQNTTIKTLSNSSSLKTLASTSTAISSASQAAHPQIPKFKNTKTVVKGKRPPQIETNISSTNNEQKYVTISETQLSQILNLVSQGIQVQQSALQAPQVLPQPAQQPVPVEVPTVEQPKAVEPVVAPQAVEEEPKVETRDELLEKSQKAVPLSMKSSFLPYEAVPRGDAVQKERREQQLAWRRELEKQRDEDALRKKKEKEEYAKQKQNDHHLTDRTQSDYKSSIKIFNQNANSAGGESATASVENISPRIGTQPLSMQSSFHPSGNVPNTESLDQQRKNQQLAWRRELEQQREEDAARKKSLKSKDQEMKLIDHHLHQADNSYQKPSIKLIQDNPNHQDNISSLASYRSKPETIEQLHGTHVAETGHHRNMNALKDPAELERLDKQRKQQQENERDLQKQIEANKRNKKSSQEDDDEPWWAKQDRKNAEIRNKQQTARPIVEHQKPPQPQVTVEVLHSCLDPSKIELKQESTVAPLKLEDLNSRRSPSPVRKTVKTAKQAPKTVLDEQIPTDTELKAQERNLAKKKRQMALLEEQLKVEERLRTMRIKKEADKTVSVKKPSTSREKDKNPATTARSKHSKQSLTEKKMTSRVQEKPKEDVLNNSMNISFKQQDTATLLEQLTSLESALKHRQHKLLTK